MDRKLSLAQMGKVVQMEVRYVVAQAVPSTIAKHVQLITIMTGSLTNHPVIKGVRCAPSKMLLIMALKLIMVYTAECQVCIRRI